MREPDGAVNWLHGDHLGSTSLATDGVGEQVSRQLYYPFGEVRWASAEMPTDFGYTGQRLDGTGLMFYHARYYAPTLGRFVSADTIVPKPGEPQYLNRYSYVRNNPLRYVDPSGHVDCDKLGDPDDEAACRYSKLPKWDETPPGDIPASPPAFYWRGMTEAQLAAFKQCQGSTNYCHSYSVATTVNMLTKSSLQGDAVADMANAGWWLGKDTIFLPGQGGLPSQQVNQIEMINWLAERDGMSLNLSAEAMKGTTSDLINLLGQPDKAVIVTIQWDEGDPTSGHAMVLAAYDLTHVDWHGNVQPWGFINSADNTSVPHLFWMTNDEFQKVWGNWGELSVLGLCHQDVTFALGGNHNMVVVSAP
jgi:RHS repeat-associated protein